MPSPTAVQALPAGSKVTLFNDHNWSDEKLGEARGPVVLVLTSCVPVSFRWHV